MFRQASSRNHRSKGIRIKHVLQICLLLAVCLWLLYQVKHSHDKKVAFDEHNAKHSENLQRKQEILKLGRKDLNQRDELSSSQIEKQHEEVENEEEEEGKHEETEDEEKEEGGDEIDEHGQEKAEEESEHREDFGDEEENKENEEKEEEENQENEDKEVEENPVKEEEENQEKEEEEENLEKELKEEEENKENEGTGEGEESKNSHEAREAQYNGDDASSAVVKKITSSESGNEASVKPDEENRENSENYEAEIDKKNNATMDFTINQKGNDSSPITETVESHLINSTDIQLKDGTVSLSKIESGVLANATMANDENPEKEIISNPTMTNSIDQTLVNNNNSGEANRDNLALSLGNETTNLDPTEEENRTLKIETVSDQGNPNLQTVVGEPNKSNTTMEEGEEDTKSLNTSTEIGKEQTENPKSTVGAGESNDNSVPSTPDENSKEVPVETTDSNASMVGQEEKEGNTNLETFRKKETAEENSVDVAAV